MMASRRGGSRGRRHPPKRGRRLRCESVVSREDAAADGSSARVYSAIGSDAWGVASERPTSSTSRTRVRRASAVNGFAR